jgi:hypothetical protein
MEPGTDIVLGSKGGCQREAEAQPRLPMPSGVHVQVNGQRARLLGDHSLSGESASHDVIAQPLDVPSKLAHQLRGDAGTNQCCREMLRHRRELTRSDFQTGVSMSHPGPDLRIIAGQDEAEKVLLMAPQGIQVNACEHRRERGIVQS